jgi:hypothetical protein
LCGEERRHHTERDDNGSGECLVHNLEIGLQRYEDLYF